jgi:trans-aconitate methyltransferase
MIDKQALVWQKKEADNWFKRNKNSLGSKEDLIMFIIELYKIKPKKVIEIGCSNGYRLSKIHEKYGSRVVGIEPSQKALKDGKKKWPFIKFINGMCESFSLKEKVDLVIINFVFHWISRQNLLECFSRIDKIVENNGYIIIGDFGTENSFKRKYHHLKDKEIFTYKQEYQNLLKTSRLYREIAMLKFNHDTGEITSHIDDNDMGTLSLLQKHQMYVQY